MFTGIISDVGTLIGHDGGRLTIRTGYAAQSFAVGASLACDGCCLTVTAIAHEGKGATVAVEVSNETLSRTTLADWAPGQRINLERPLKVGDELGGHIVSGHVDGVASVLAIEPDGASRRFTLDAPAPLARYIAEKGSVTLDGTSLTVNQVNGSRFTVNIIAHTLTVTTWGAKTARSMVNLEVDVLARHVARILELKS